MVRRPAGGRYAVAPPLKRLRHHALVAAMAVAAAGASSLVPRSSVARHAEIMGCETGCVVVAGGWPLPYLVDYPGISPVGSVSLANGLLGVDRIEAVPLIITLAFWWGVVAGLAALMRWRASGAGLPCR